MTPSAPEIESAAVTAAPPPTGDRWVRRLGWIASLTAVLMYLSYGDQIARNLHGEKGSLLQPLAALVNCTLWVAYGLLRPARDWPVVVANAPGVVLGAAAFLTAL